TQPNDSCPLGPVAEQTVCSSPSATTTCLCAPIRTVRAGEPCLKTAAAAHAHGPLFEMAALRQRVALKLILLARLFSVLAPCTASTSFDQISAPRPCSGQPYSCLTCMLHFRSLPRLNTASLTYWRISCCTAQLNSQLPPQQQAEAPMIYDSEILDKITLYIHCACCVTACPAAKANQSASHTADTLDTAIFSQTDSLL